MTHDPPFSSLLVLRPMETAGEPLLELQPKMTEITGLFLRLAMVSSLALDVIDEGFKSKRTKKFFAVERDGTLLVVATGNRTQDLRDLVETWGGKPDDLLKCEWKKR